MVSVAKFVRQNGQTPEGNLLRYGACGLDGVYLLNGWSRENVDGEDYLAVEDLDGLWKTIGFHLVSERKSLESQEIRFLREHMDLTQAELAAKVRVADQTIARREKGETETPGSADFMVRILFLTSERAQPEGRKIIDKVSDFLDDIIKRDEPPTRSATFRHAKKKWKEEVCLCA
jgi:transcriptional regulator with XRE-family HTH domain